MSKRTVPYEAHIHPIQRKHRIANMSSLENEAAHVNMSSSSSNSGSDVEQQGTRKMSGLERPRAALDALNETPITETVDDHVSIDQAHISDQGSVNQGTINGLVKALEKLNGDLETFKAANREELAALKEELAAAISAQARLPLPPPPPPAVLPAEKQEKEDPATPNPSRQGSWWKDMGVYSEEGDNRHKYGHVARNEGSGNSVFQSGGGGSWGRARNAGDGNSISQRSSGKQDFVECFGILVLVGVFIVGIWVMIVHTR
ncbi:hypothetical protein F4820DRAFT_437115 [Hypoxylon rubiginosum]|uniref:Uncharacterized protein n=1 Tax=Hypoxylon rubiginosum TaxID=110542 RepID=A0ACB9YM85_9PEZI|nr:hypothetical protein F4820DRAFT_437115 [Hypoxylon rubiginosum]